MNVSLPLAVFWLLLSLILFLWPVFNPGAQWPTIWGTGISMGWVCLLLAVYNLLRWWSRRAFRAERRLLEEDEQRRTQRPAGPPPAREPDPNFNFTEPAPPPKKEDNLPPP